ncbi:MAG: hypothetical protein M1833_004318 [Piccolia ochrophora]|nr:MAG: hypothetical protein M1833_004318 [Piccolia ochrophora]
MTTSEPDGDIAFDSLEKKCCEVLQHSGTPEASIWIQRDGHVILSKTLHRDTPNRRPSECDEHGKRIYGVAHLAKSFIAYAACIMFFELACSKEPDDSKYKPLKGGWRKPISRFLNVRLPKYTTIEQLLVNYIGPPGMNDLIFGPDGSLQTSESKENILSLITNAAQEEWPLRMEQMEWSESSDIGHLLVGMLIEKYADMSLGDFLKQHVFGPLGMGSTYLKQDSISPQGDNVVTPYVVATDLTPLPIEHPKNSKIAPVTVSRCLYSCTHDLAIFLRKILEASTMDSGEIAGSRRISKSLVDFCLVPTIENQPKDRGSTTHFGSYIDLKDEAIGSQSFNRVVSDSTSKASRYSLGTRLDGQVAKAHYRGGYVRGYECCYYLVQEHSWFVIVLTNATGRTDAADHISRLVLQHQIELRKGHSFHFVAAKTQRALKWTSSNAVGSHGMVDVLQMTQKCIEERQKYLFDKHFRLKESATPNDLCGLYWNGIYDQAVRITNEANVGLVVAVGGIALGGRWTWSASFSLDEEDYHEPTDDSSTVNKLLITPLPSSNDTIFDLDIYHEWRDLKVVRRRNRKGCVVRQTLKRKKRFMEIVYDRSP